MIDCSEFVQNGQPKWWVPYFLQNTQYILDALEYSGGTHSLEDVAMALNKDEMQLWPGLDSAIVTQIITYPRKKFIHIFLAAGNMDEILRTIPFIEQHGKMEGCDQMSICGRKGWAKPIEKLHKTESKIFLTKEI
jgi:hypothetical protein